MNNFTEKEMDLARKAILIAKDYYKQLSHQEGLSQDDVSKYIDAYTTCDVIYDKIRK